MTCLARGMPEEEEEEGPSSNGGARYWTCLLCGYDEFVFDHVMLLLPNPCYERCTIAVEAHCVAALKKLLFLRP